MNELNFLKKIPTLYEKALIIDSILYADGFFLEGCNVVTDIFGDDKCFNDYKEFTSKGMLFYSYFRGEYSDILNINVKVCPNFYIDIREDNFSFKIGDISLSLEYTDAFSENSVELYKKTVLHFLNENTDISADTLENYFSIFYMTRI